jgi:hypothetical protein
MVHAVSPPPPPLPLPEEPLVARRVTCPLCHMASSLTEGELGAGGYWRCARCGQDWDAARVAAFHACAAWAMEHESATHPPG